MSREHTAHPWVIPGEDGAYDNVLDLHYRQWPALSQTEMKLLERSPAHLKAEREDPPTITAQRQRGFDLGSMAHMAVLQPDEAENWFQRRPPGRSNSKAYQTAAGKMMGANAWLRLLHPDDFDTALRIRDAVHAHTEASRIVTGSQVEVSIVWQDEKTGVRCKGRLDIRNPSLGLIGDFKTCFDARPDKFTRQVEDLRYYRQAAWYSRAAMAAGFPERDWIFLTVEKQAPFALWIHQLSDFWMGLGDDEAEGLLDVYADCVRDDVWPAYPPGATVLEPNQWQTNNARERADRLFAG